MDEKLLKQANEIEGICERLGLTADELAYRAAIKPETLRKISKGYQPASPRLMQALRNIEEMQKMFKHGNPTAKNQNDHPQVLAAVPLIKKAPVVSWASAGVGHNYADLADYLEEDVETDCADPNTFALIIEGDSMEPVFRRGDRIVIAPNTEPKNGDITVARLHVEGDVLFKLYHTHGRKNELVRLTSYNHAYPPLEYKRSQFRFIYPIWQMTRKYGHRKP